VREDAILLYGFATIAEKHAFDLLMGVQHVGSKLALAGLSVLSPQDLVAAIMRKRTSNGSMLCPEWAPKSQTELCANCAIRLAGST
jgi:Holliday junction resolvasome RuvABC DNA-binding subunit